LGAEKVNMKAQGLPSLGQESQGFEAVKDYWYFTS
jgi:hypothetical protein